MTTIPKHLRLTAGGGWVPSNMSAEQWQIGFSLALVFGGVDPIGTFPDNWEPVSVTINRVEADWTITGNWYAQGPTPVFNPDDFLNDQAAPALATFIGAGDCFSNDVRLDWLKLAVIGSPTGHEVPAVPYLVGTPCVLEWTSSNPVGAHSTGLLPPQDSIVISTRTSQLGRRGRGRIYLPGIDVSCTTGGLVNHSHRDTLSLQAATLYEALSTTGVGPGAAQVRPCVTGKPWTDYSVINELRVGDVVDTQRRRRDRLVENYVSRSLTY